MKRGEERLASPDRTAPERELAVQNRGPCVKEERVESLWDVPHERIAGATAGQPIGFPRQEPEQKVRLAQHVAVQESVAKKKRQEGGSNEAEKGGACTATPD